MITRLLPEQISAFWPIIKYAVEEALPPMVGEHPDKMNRILAAMLSGKLDVWASYKKPDNKFEGIGVTQVLYDEPTNTKSLLLYSIYAYEKTNPDSWVEAWEAIVKWAKARGCKTIVAYSANSYVVEKAKLFGGNADFTFISFDISKFV